MEPLIKDTIQKKQEVPKFHFPLLLYVLVNVQAARRYRIYSEAVDYTGRGRSPRRGIVNSRGGYPVRAETPDVN